MNFGQMNFGQQIGALFNDYVALTNGYAAGCESLREQEKLLTGREYSSIPEFYPKSPRDAAADSMVGLLIREAEKRFAPAGATLDIPKYDVIMACGCNPTDEAFDGSSIERIWDYLFKTYGGAAGHLESWRQASAGLVKAFNIENGKLPPVEKNGMSLVVPVYVENWGSARGAKDHRLANYGTISEILRDLGGFASWAKRADVVATARGLNETFFYERTIQSRAVYGTDSLSVVTYNTKFVFRIGSDLAADFRSFVADFATT